MTTTPTQAERPVDPDDIEAVARALQGTHWYFSYADASALAVAAIDALIARGCHSPLAAQAEARDVPVSAGMLIDACTAYNAYQRQRSGSLCTADAMRAAILATRASEAAPIDSHEVDHGTHIEVVPHYGEAAPEGCTPADAQMLRAANHGLADENTALREALQFYAEGSHFVRVNEDAWDICSGEPTNFWFDEAETAQIEDGSIAKTVLAKHSFEPDADEAAPVAAGDAQQALKRAANMCNAIANGFVSDVNPLYSSERAEGAQACRDAILKLASQAEPDAQQASEPLRFSQALAIWRAAKNFDASGMELVDCEEARDREIVGILGASSQSDASATVTCARIGHGAVSIGDCLSPETGEPGIIFMALDEPREIGSDTGDAFPEGLRVPADKVLAYVSFANAAAIDQTIKVLHRIKEKYWPDAPATAAQSGATESLRTSADTLLGVIHQYRQWGEEKQAEMDDELTSAMDAVEIALSDAAKPVSVEREAFEEFMRSGDSPDISPKMDRDGEFYDEFDVQRVWLGWQARAALSATGDKA